MTNEVTKPPVCPPRLWVVIDEAGQPGYCASWPDACHEHINDALMGGYGAAARWVVREYGIVAGIPATGEVAPWPPGMGLEPEKVAQAKERIRDSVALHQFGQAAEKELGHD